MNAAEIEYQSWLQKPKYSVLTCPFCGRAPKLDTRKCEYANSQCDARAYVRCDYCRLSPMASGSRSNGYITDADRGRTFMRTKSNDKALTEAIQAAIREWNTRAAECKLVDIVVGYAQ